MKDCDLLKNLQSTNFLKEKTKNEYISRLTLFSKIAKRSIFECIKEPVWTINQILKYVQKNNFGIHTADKIASCFISIFTYNQTFKENHKDLYLKWVSEISNRIKSTIDKKYESNAPTKRQIGAYVNFDKIIETRNKLKHGSQERLLLFMYTEIPPVRNDFYRMKIYRNKPKFDINNYLVLRTNPRLKSYITLNEFKTAGTYKQIKFDIPSTLVREIQLSLTALPRDYLFVSTRNNETYNSPNSFDQWANRTLKQIFNCNISLTTLRHIYLSRRDLQIETRSGSERKIISSVMGHSLAQQQKYLWHAWLEEEEKKNTS